MGAVFLFWLRLKARVTMRRPARGMALVSFLAVSLPRTEPMPITDHPQRAGLTNELHARPSPAFTAPAQVGFVVLKPEQNAVSRPAENDLNALAALTRHYGLPAPDPAAKHYRGDLGRAALKWEKHTEVTSYTLMREGAASRDFDPGIFDLLPPSWNAAVSDARLTSVLVDVALWTSEQEVETYLREHFSAESLVASYVLDEAALIAGDFRMDGAGHIRFAVFVRPETGPNRIGRIVQRLCEIETYKTLSMLGFEKARSVSLPLVDVDERLTGLLSQMERGAADDTLSVLLDISGEIERHASVVAFRFAATEAYETLVGDRIAVLRATRFRGRQTLGEFMMRRFDPAMRTVASTRRKLDRMAARASNAAELLRTRVDVDRSAQSQRLLESMDRRADAQLQLQKTVEGLSVVAIGYYAVSLAGYLLAPVAKTMGWDKATLMALSAVPILLCVWWIVRSIRARH